MWPRLNLHQNRPGSSTEMHCHQPMYPPHGQPLGGHPSLRSLQWSSGCQRDADLPDATSSRPPFLRGRTASSERWTPSDRNAGRDQIRMVGAIRSERLDGFPRNPQVIPAIRHNASAESAPSNAIRSSVTFAVAVGILNRTRTRRVEPSVGNVAMAPGRGAIDGHFDQPVADMLRILDLDPENAGRPPDLRLGSPRLSASRDRSAVRRSEAAAPGSPRCPDARSTRRNRCTTSIRRAPLWGATLATSAAST